MIEICLLNPSLVFDNYLVEEYKLIPQIIAEANRGGVEIPKIYDPKEKSFFYDKIIFLYNRFLTIEQHLLEREIKFDKIELPKRTDWDRLIAYDPNMQEIAMSELNYFDWVYKQEKNFYFGEEVKLVKKEK